MRNGSACCTPRGSSGVYGTEFDAWLNNILPGFEARSACCEFAAPANLVETPTTYEISVDLPGLTAEAVQIEYHEGILTVSGERVAEGKVEGRKLLRAERGAGKFSRSFKLPDVDADQITAQYKNGVLTIAVPKTPAATARKIEIKMG